MVREVRQKFAKDVGGGHSKPRGAKVVGKATMNNSNIKRPLSLGKQIA